MCDPQRVVRFLDFSSSQGWDPTLMAVLGCGVTVTAISFHLIKHFKPDAVLDPIGECSKPVNVGACLKMGFVPENTKIDWKLLAGSAIFGIGWGLGGVCPGPGLVSLGATEYAAGVFIPSMIAGMVAQSFVVSK
jgi:uncharacterized membrane protein YedE/YeeE